MSAEKNTGYGTKGLVRREPLLIERSVAGRRGCSLPSSFGDVTSVEQAIPQNLRRQQPPALPELDEPSVVRHFTRLSTWNHGVDSGMYPLGSCTMKYNPRLNEQMARLEGFARLHPYAPEGMCQGALQLMWELEQALCEITGLKRFTLQPAAGAHGELCGMKMVRAYHRARGNPRQKVIIPDTAHGTNPASAHMSGYRVVEVKSGPAGYLQAEAVKPLLDEQVAAIMLTNPNTLGVFEREIEEIAKLMHEAGALVYCDGANLNSLMGIARPGDMGVDVLQVNLHKTFSTPHGGGGPGSGPVGVSEKLVPFLPVPTIEKDSNGKFFFDYYRPQSIGRMKFFYGNFAVMIRAYSYILELGGEGLRRATELAVLNANYLRARLSKILKPAVETPSLHEAVFSDQGFEALGISTLDVAKRLIDYGFHPPTVYFPLVVHGALMIEPTETESKETLDEFVAALESILQEARLDARTLHDAPQNTHIARLDEVAAAREPKMRW